MTSDRAGGGAPAMAIHTYILGAHAFAAGTLTAIRDEAVGFADAAWPDAVALARWFALPAPVAADLRPRLRRKLLAAAVDDLRLDFEDGYVGSAAAELADAERTGKLLADLLAHLPGQLSDQLLGAPPGDRPDGQPADQPDDQPADRPRARPADQPAGRPAGRPGGQVRGDRCPWRFGLRIRPLVPATADRSLTVLERFVGALCDGIARAGGVLAPGRLVVNLAKAETAEQTAALAAALARLERQHGLAPATIAVELMAETTRGIYAADGRLAAPALLAPLAGRARRICFGVYDFTASCGVVAGLQGLRHPLCDAARAALLFAVAGSDVELADGSSQLVPRLAAGGSPAAAEAEAKAASIYADVRHSLANANVIGWDLHPTQVAIRMVAVYAFYREQLAAMAARMRRALETAGSASLASGALEDAATAEALFGFFRRGHACGALDDGDLALAALAPPDLVHDHWRDLLAARPGAPR